MTCIKCQKNPAQRIQLCIPCWALVVYGEPDRLPPFPPLSVLAAQAMTAPEIMRAFNAWGVEHRPDAVAEPLRARVAAPVGRDS